MRRSAINLNDNNNKSYLPSLLGRKLGYSSKFETSRLSAGTDEVSGVKDAQRVRPLLLKGPMHGAWAGRQKRENAVVELFMQCESTDPDFLWRTSSGLAGQPPAATTSHERDRGMKK
jgi:hypothetical protein